MKQRILVIEDNVPQAESLALVLRHEGFRVFLAGVVEQAKKQLQVHGADAVILDLWLPGGSGRQFLTWLRQQPGYESVPVVVSTGLNYDEVADLDHEPRVKVLIKSHTVRELLAVLASMGIHGGENEPGNGLR